MDRSSLIVVVIPIVIPIALFTGMALPFVAASRSGRSHARRRLASADARKRTGAAGRKARPQKPRAHDDALAGYLYVPCVHNPHNDYSAGTRRWVQQVPIVKKTAKLIYYTSDSWDRRQAVVSPGCISREQFETDTRCHDTCPRDIAAGLVCAPHGRGHRHCVHVLAPGRHCHAPGGCGDDCPADTRGWRCAQHGYTWEHCPHGEDRCRRGYPADVIPVPGHRHRPGPAGSSSPPARPPKNTCTAEKASEPDMPHRKHHSSRNCAAPWPMPTPTGAAPPSSSSKRTAGIRQCSGPREGNVLTSPTLADTTTHASRRTDDGPGQGMPASHSTEPCGGRRPADNPSILAGVRGSGPRSDKPHPRIIPGGPEPANQDSSIARKGSQW